MIALTTNGKHSWTENQEFTVRGEENKTDTQIFEGIRPTKNVTWRINDCENRARGQ